MGGTCCSKECSCRTMRVLRTFLPLYATLAAKGKARSAYRATAALARSRYSMVGTCGLSHVMLSQFAQVQRSVRWRRAFLRCDGYSIKATCERMNATMVYAQMQIYTSLYCLLRTSHRLQQASALSFLSGSRLDLQTEGIQPTSLRK